jgi:predicted CXXCH cytochrome family protein
MSGRRTNRRRLCQAAVLCVLIVLTGCDRGTRHKVLTFFFTGVPPLEEQNRSTDEGRAGAAASKLPGEKPAPPKLYNHPHYASGRCDKCHDVPSNFRLLGQKKIGGTPFRKGGGSPGKILAPIEELCVGCHQDKSSAELQSAALWLHSPAAKGECRSCHDAHQSTHSHILLKDRQLICGGCHFQSPVMQRGDHQDPATCLGCHNPHLGINRCMLKNEFLERSVTHETIGAPK